MSGVGRLWRWGYKSGPIRFHLSEPGDAHCSHNPYGAHNSNSAASSAHDTHTSARAATDTSNTDASNSDAHSRACAEAGPRHPGG